jgi:hypothetical protein
MDKYRHAKKVSASCNRLITVSIDENVVAELTTYCEENDYVRTKLVELILEEFLDRFEHKDEKK